MTGKEVAGFLKRPLTRKEFHSEKDGTFPSNSDVGQYYVMVL